MEKIQKILIANRGEIALRVIRSVREMGIKSVAVYSEADRAATHVMAADEAIFIGPAPSTDSYLNIEAVVQAALSTGADAIHPGYGFLAENARFAQKVKSAGLIFIGPSPYAIRTMGDKLKAKAAVAKREIPMVPGYDKPVGSVQEAKKMANSIGYPVLIKASAGGGGKGMRIVEQEKDLGDQLERAKSEATSAFGNGEVFIEKFITNPKHIEIQVLADNHGNVVHLFERECSVQRRHQKVIEEAPSPVVDWEMRRKMGEAATEVARACKYSGAGTVEFVVDGNLDFFFLEMNTRLQVEHPVTELITGTDLVKEQIKIAQDLPLSFEQEGIRLEGHAIEARIYAEDPRNNFLPDIGTLTSYQLPISPGIRVDGGYQLGMKIPIYYDPLISKVIAYGQNREEAITRLRLALEDYVIGGVETTVDFCHFVLQHPEFKSGRFDTGFVEKYFQPSKLNSKGHSGEREIAAALASYVMEAQNKAQQAQPSPPQGNWKRR